VHQLATRQHAIRGDFACVNRAAAAEADEAIAIDAFDLVLEQLDRASWYVLHCTREDRRAMGTQRTRNSAEDRKRRDHVCSDDHGPLQLPPFHLVFKSRYFPGTIDHALETSQIEFAYGRSGW
jgi:hypothetical protein